MNSDLSKQEEKKNQKQQIIQSYRRSAVKDHQRILQRKQIIEDRKERLESITVQRVSSFQIISCT